MPCTDELQDQSFIQHSTGYFEGWEIGVFHCPDAAFVNEAAAMPLYASGKEVGVTEDLSSVYPDNITSSLW